MMLQDEKILRDLALQYREIANSETNRRNKRLHIAVNDLHMERPVLLMDEIPWHEFACRELALQCRDPFLREMEQQMRQVIYRQKHFPLDMVVPDALRVTKIIHTTGIGMDIRDEKAVNGGHGPIISRRFIDQMEDEECLELLHNEVITYDQEASEERLHKIENIVGDIIPVRLIGDQWCFDTLWDDVARLHGIENMLIDFIDRPEYMHDIAEKFTQIFLDKVRQYEELDLFEGRQDLLHGTAAYTDELPAEDHEGDAYRARDVWGRGAAQVLVSASPAVREEFDLPYMARAMAPFGLVYYGCCEPLHGQVETIGRLLPNLRKLTVTPWANYEQMAEEIGTSYVYSAKANPAHLALNKLNEDVIHKEFRRIVGCCEKNNCNFEIVLKDISTVSDHPENLERWAQIAGEYVHD